MKTRPAGPIAQHPCPPAWRTDRSRLCLRSHCRRRNDGGWSRPRCWRRLDRGCTASGCDLNQRWSGIPFVRHRSSAVAHDQRLSHPSPSLRTRVHLGKRLIPGSCRRGRSAGPTEPDSSAMRGSRCNSATDSGHAACWARAQLDQLKVAPRTSGRMRMLLRARLLNPRWTAAFRASGLVENCDSQPISKWRCLIGSETLGGVRPSGLFGWGTLNPTCEQQREKSVPLSTI
jgi:hypothetical protein